MKKKSTNMKIKNAELFIMKTEKESSIRSDRTLDHTP